MLISRPVNFMNYLLQGVSERRERETGESADCDNGQPNVVGRAGGLGPARPPGVDYGTYLYHYTTIAYRPGSQPFSWKLVSGRGFLSSRKLVHSYHQF